MGRRQCCLESRVILHSFCILEGASLVRREYTRAAGQRRFFSLGRAYSIDKGGLPHCVARHGIAASSLV